MRSDVEYSYVECCLVRDTMAAILIAPLNGGEVWIPKSACSYYEDDIGTGELVEIEIADWIVRRENL